MSAKTKNSDQKNVTYSIGDLVLGKIRGYSPWPGLIVDVEGVPAKVKKEQPKNRGTFHCVRFLTAGDYSFLQSKDLTPLQKHEIEAFVAEPPKNDKALLEAYQAALNPQEWLKAKETEAEQYAENEANDPVDQLDESGEENGQTKKTKKRKRDSEPKSKGPAKTKKAGDSSAAKKKTEKAKKSSKNVESEDEGAVDEEEGGKDGSKTSAPPTKKAKRDDEDPMEKDPEAKKVRDWRHKLQKVLLNSKAPAKPEDIPNMDQLFTTIEQYENMTLAYLTFSKIGKVMRHVTQLPQDKLPRDAEFNIRNRAQALVDKWSTHINGATGDKAAAAETKPDSKPAEAPVPPATEDTPAPTANGEQPKEEAAEQQPEPEAGAATAA